ncbi:MAG: hypothetical protein RKE49_02515 [Oceanicaulis sp.]
MQYRFSLLPGAAAAVRTAISPERLAKYEAVAKGDRNLALQLYNWNCELCGAFYAPLNLAEVAARNAIVTPVEKRFGPNWHLDHRFSNILDAQKRQDLAEAMRRERRQHGTRLTAHHVTSALSFGFWVGLTARSYDRHLWATGVRRSFPHADNYYDRDAIHTLLDRIRRTRNDVMHMRSIFDKAPRRKLSAIDELLGLICLDTQFFLRQTHTLEDVIGRKPRRG